MLILAWIIVFLLGYAVLLLCCYQLRQFEKIAFALPVGLGLSSVVMFLIDIMGIPLNSIPVLLSAEVVIIGACLFVAQKMHGSLKPDLAEVRSSLEFPKWDAAYYLLLLGILTMLIMIGIKSVIWPIASYDAVTGYDMLAKIIAAEGSFNNSVFDKVNSIETLRTGYPPLYPYVLSYARIFGTVNPQMTCIFWYVPMAISFYALLRHYVTPLGAAVFTLLLLTTPDYADFSSISSNNTPLAYYAGLGLISMYIWYDKGNKTYFTLGLILIALGNWDRLEGFFFYLSAAILVFLRCRKTRSYKPFLLFSVISILPLIVWQLYLKLVLEADISRSVRLIPVWDWERLKTLFNLVAEVSFSTFYYGIVIFLGLVLIAVNALLIIITKKKMHWLFILCLIAGWIAYVLLFYQMRDNFATNGLITASYKRGLYAYIPPLLFGVAVLYLSQYFFGLQNQFRFRRVDSERNRSGEG